jgi:hypothetical protein
MPLLDKLASPKGNETVGTDVFPSEKKPESHPVLAPDAKEDAPPSYAPVDPETTQGPSVEELNAAFSSLNLRATAPSFPNEDQCLAHLKLLSTFHILKEDIGYTDGLFNLWDAKCETVENRDETLARMREKRWTLYVARAAERFESWWLRVLCDLEPSKRLEGKEMVVTCKPYSQFTQRGQVQTWTTAMLPPIGNSTP